MKRSVISRRAPHLVLPDMAPIAGTIFVLVCFFLLTASFRESPKGLVALERLPRSTGTLCLVEAPRVLVSLTPSGCFSFAASDTKLQFTVIKRVSKKYGIAFSAPQLLTLKSLPFLASNVERLPSILLSTNSIQSNTIPAAPNTLLDERQLMDCVKTAKANAYALLGSPVYFCLCIDAETDASKVMRLLGLLQTQGIHRFLLMTQAQ